LHHQPIITVLEEEQQDIIKKDPYSSLRFAEFRWYLSMRFLFTFGYQMQAVIIGYYIYQLTNSKLALAFAGLAEAFPAIGIALYGGYVADKSEKKRLMLLIFSTMWLCSVVLLLATSPSAHQYISAHTVLAIIYAMIFVIGLGRGFYGPTAFSIMARIIPRELYQNSSTWNSGTFQFASVVAPLLGGALFAIFGITVTFTVVLSFITLALFAITFLNRHPAEYIPKESIYESLREGIRFYAKSRLLLGAQSLDLFSVLFGGVVAVLPVFAKDILKVGPSGFGMMCAADSVGAVLTMLVMTRYSPMGKPWRNLLIAVAGFGMSIICFGLSQNFYLSLFFLFTLGAFDSVSMVIRSTIMQLLTPDKMRGRVSAVNSMFINSSNEIGKFESGVAAQLMGTITSVMFGGGMTLAIVTITWLKTKKLVPLTTSELHSPAPEEIAVE
jgi:MFS family permease